MEVSMSLESQF